MEEANCERDGFLALGSMGCGVETYKAAQMACLNGDFQSAEQLLLDPVRGWHCDATQGQTLLRLAIQGGNLEIVNLILKFCDDVDPGDECGRSALHLACACNNIKVVRTVLDCNRVDLNAFDQNGNTALHDVVRSGELSLLELLLECPRVDVNAPNKNGHTALHLVCYLHRRDLTRLRMLLDCPRVDTCAVAKDGWTALFGAAVWGSAGATTALLAREEVPVNAVDKHGKTVLHWACQWNRTEPVEALLECIRVDPGIVDKMGRSALQTAKVKDNVNMVRNLQGSVQMNRAWKARLGWRPSATHSR